jgi:hypothetical protein
MWVLRPGFASGGDRDGCFGGAGAALIVVVAPSGVPWLWCVPAAGQAGAGSARRRPNASASACAQGQLLWMRSVALRA